MRRTGFVLLSGMLVAIALLRLASSPLAPPEDSAPAEAAAEVAGDGGEPGASASEPPPLQEYAADCFQALRSRNPVGRVLKLNANRLGDRCSIIVETAEGSARWLFDWRDGDAGWQREGEVRWPQAWPAEAPSGGIDAQEFAPPRLAALMASARSRWPESERDDWLYEIVWLPAPFRRPLVYITFDDLRPEAGPYDGHSVIYDDGRALEGEEHAQADALYPLTRFELREDHSFKGALYESSALAESAISLEGDAAAEASDPLHAGVERCMYWLRQVNAGTRLLRVALDAERCWLLQENASLRDDFYVFSARDTEHFAESASLALEAPPPANLLLDRSRLSAARVRERAAQARAAQAGLRVERLAVAWVDGAMLWQFDGRARDRRIQVWLAEDGQVIAPPAQFPVSAEELDSGFPASSPLLAVAAESPLADAP